MSQLTITEALAEIKTLEKRVEKKRQSIQPYLARQDGVRDPLEKTGGSAEFIKSERQSIKDLETNIIKLRIGINRANDATSITILDESKSISEWIIWRRDISKHSQNFLTVLRNGVNTIRQNAQRQGVAIIQQTVGTDNKPNDWIINVDEAALIADAEKLETILGTLDGQLSLKNATTLITY